MSKYTKWKEEEGEKNGETSRGGMEGAVGAVKGRPNYTQTELRFNQQQNDKIQKSVSNDDKPQASGLKKKKKKE